MKRRSSLRLIEWPMPPISGDVRQIIFTSLLHLGGGVLNGFHNILVPGTAAQIPGDPPADLFLAGIRVLAQQGIRRHQHARSAEAALQTMLFLESLLQRMELTVLHKAFHCEQFAAISLYGKHGARFDRLSIEQNSACAAMGSVTTDVGACQSGNSPDKVDQQ